MSVYVKMPRSGINRLICLCVFMMSLESSRDSSLSSCLFAMQYQSLHINGDLC